MSDLDWATRIYLQCGITTHLGQCSSRGGNHRYPGCHRLKHRHPEPFSPAAVDESLRVAVDRRQRNIGDFFQHQNVLLDLQCTNQVEYVMVREVTLTDDHQEWPRRSELRPSSEQSRMIFPRFETAHCQKERSIDPELPHSVTARDTWEKAFVIDSIWDRMHFFQRN